MSNNGFHEEVESQIDEGGCVEVSVTQYHKDTYGIKGNIRIQTDNVGPDSHNVWFSREESKKLRKALKRAEKFLES